MTTEPIPDPATVELQATEPPPAQPFVAAEPAQALPEPDDAVLPGLAQPAPAETAGAAAEGTRSAPVDIGLVAALLAQHFPALFGGPPQPIKLHVHADIQARAPGVFTRRALSAFLHRHTTSTAYLVALSQAAHRVDLDGQPAGEISAEHRESALQELARRRALRKPRQATPSPSPADRRRRDLEEQQRRNRARLLSDFEITTLTRPNFCALKGVPPDELDGLLEIARSERGQADNGSRPTAVRAGKTLGAP